MIFKAIFTGHLDFGTERSYQQVLKMYRSRVENYYKSDILLTEENIFFEEKNAVIIGKQTMNCSKRFWRNTYLLMDYIAQFAVSGSIKIWLIDEGKIDKYIEIEPSGDRTTVTFYKQGCELMKAGKLKEALEAFTKSIETYNGCEANGHSDAYEKRGMVQQLLGNLDAAYSDFQKSIRLYDGNPQAHFGIGKIALDNDDLKTASEHLTLAIKHSIPHQQVHWLARYRKGDAHYLLNELSQAEAEYRYFCRRNFTDEDPNFVKKRLALLKWGKVLLKIKDKQEDALSAFDEMLKVKEIQDGLTVGQMRLWRGKARHQVGKKGFREDWLVAKKEGLDEAKQLLETYA
jgi:tetratricopeptide (TPR) repeat protein